MRVVKSGTAKTPFVKTIVCECKCEFEIGEDDLIEAPGAHYALRCPECDAQRRIERSDVPEHVRRRVTKRARVLWDYRS